MDSDWLISKCVENQLQMEPYSLSLFRWVFRAACVGSWRLVVDGPGLSSEKQMTFTHEHYPCVQTLKLMRN